MRKILLLAALLAMTAGFLACGGAGSSGGGSTPTEAYKNLYQAVKAKDTEAIKANMTKKTQEFAQMVSQRNNTPIEKVYENGFTATTFSPSLPEMRDERIAEDMGALEVWNARDNRWEDLGFVKEDGAWRLAVGEQFAGTYKKPGKGRDQLEREAANLMSNNQVEVKPQGNANVNVVVPKNVPLPQPPQANAANPN